MSLILGPNNIIGEIYSSGWNNYVETFENTITLEPISNSGIVSGTISYRDKVYEIIYNEIIIEKNIFNYRLVYIPKQNYTTTILTYGNLNNFKINDNKVIFETTMRNAEDDKIDDIVITLIVRDDKIGILYNIIN